MSDPVAEAAAQIAAQQAEPSLLEKAMDTIHDLEAKVEHLIHPEAESPNAAPAAVDGAPEAGAAPVAGGDAGNVVAGGAEPASSGLDTSAPTVSAAEVYLPNAVSAVAESTTGTASAPSASGSGETSSIGGSSDEPVNMRLSADPLHVRIAAHLEAIAGHLNAIYSTAKDAPTAAATGTSALKTHVGDILHRISNGMAVTEGELVQKLEALYRML